MTICVKPKVVTSYHRIMIDSEFLTRLEMFITADLTSQLPVPADDIHGTIVPCYNEERYCGPNSAVKDFYHLELTFRAGPAIVGNFKDDISYDASSKTFGPRCRHRRLLVITQARQHQDRTLDEPTPGRDCLFRFSICPTFNPGPRFAGAEFSAKITSKGGVHVQSSFEYQSAVEAGFVEAIKSGIAFYATNPPEDLAPMPSGQIIIEKL